MPQMKLFQSPTSPFARKVRIVAHERGLTDQITEVPSKLRSPENPVLAYSARGKVPCLVVEEGPDTGLVLIASATVCEYLNQFGDAPSLLPAAGLAYWQEKALDGFAHAFLDSIAWRSREFRPPENERSPGFVAIETERQRRCFADLETRVDELAAQEIALAAF